MYTALGNSSSATIIHHMIDPSKIHGNPLEIARDVCGFSFEIIETRDELDRVAVSLFA